ncbi:MAG: hypothetical protein K940chlam9_00483 [Chlamydiae bacterium]|nr:hypothetical protein [Chlamydiota bacterium]
MSSVNSNNIDVRQFVGEGEKVRAVTFRKRLYTVLPKNEYEIKQCGDLYQGKRRVRDVAFIAGFIVSGTAGWLFTGCLTAAIGVVGMKLGMIYIPASITALGLASVITALVAYSQLKFSHEEVKDILEKIVNQLDQEIQAKADHYCELLETKEKEVEDQVVAEETKALENAVKQIQEILPTYTYQAPQTKHEKEVGDYNTGLKKSREDAGKELEKLTGLRDKLLVQETEMNVT